MKDLSEKLLSLTGVAERRLREIDESESTRPVLFVRAALQASLDFPADDQDGNIQIQAVQDADWALLVTLWAAYNRYFAHLIARLPASKLETVCRIGSDDAVTLRFLATDYLRHLVHHLNQIGAAE